MEWLVSFLNLQQPRQFGLSVGNVARLVRRESLDDLAETGEGQVDALALGEGVPGVGADTSLPWGQISLLGACHYQQCLTPTVPLTTGQIHQVQLGLPDVLVPEGVAVDDLEVDGEDGVGPGGVRVHGGGGGHPVGDALLEEHGHLGYAVHLQGKSWRYIRALLSLVLYGIRFKDR